MKILAIFCCNYSDPQQKTVKSIEICMRFAYLKWNILQWVTDGLAGESCELSSRGGFKKNWIKFQKKSFNDFKFKKKMK